MITSDGASIFSNLRVVLDPSLPPDMIEMRGARGSTVRMRVPGLENNWRPVDYARARKLRQSLRWRRQRFSRRARRGTLPVTAQNLERLGWAFIGATEQPWELPGR